MGLLSVLKGLTLLLPVMFSIMTAMMLSGASYNFTAQKICSPDGVPEDINRFICHDQVILDQINEITTTAASMKSVCAAMGSAFFGFIRDVYGKNKPLMYIGGIVELTVVIVYLASTFYWSSTPWIPQIVHAVLAGSCGELIMQLGTTCLLIQESTPEELPMRLQIFMTGSMFLTLVAGAIATMILTTFGYQCLFITAMLLQIISIILVITMIKEKENVTKNLQESLASLKNMFKWRDDLIVLWLMFLASPLSIAILTGESANSLSFFQIKFHFSMDQSTTFNSCSFLVAIVGSMLVPQILRKVFHCQTLTIGIIASLMNCVAAVATAFVESQLCLYLFTILNFMKLVTLPLPNIIISRILNHDEIGTHLGFAAVITIWVPYSTTKIYRVVFHNYRKNWISAYFFVSAGSFLLLAIIFSISHCLYDESEKTEEMAIKKEKLERTVEI